MAAGMLSGLFNPTEKDLLAAQRDENTQLDSLAQNGPFAALARTAYEGGHTAGRGLGTMLASAAGADARSPLQRYSDAVEKAKAEVAKLGFNPDDPNTIDDFYKHVIMILQQQGLAADALAVGKEYSAQKHQRATEALGLKAETRKASTAAAQDARAAERNQILMQKFQAQGPEIVRLLGMLDEMNADTGAKDPYKEKAIMARIDSLSGGGIKVVNAGDHYVVVDAKTGAEISKGDIGAKPASEKDQTKNDQAMAQVENAYQQTKLSLQQNYDNAVELYNHPGLKDAVGVLAGMISRDSEHVGVGDFLNRARLSDVAKAAVAKLQQVRGQTFIGALTDLKAASPKTGATGLGSLTEVEGKKIQNAKAALDPQQGYASFRQYLSQYVHQIESSGQVLDDGAKRYGIETFYPLRVKPLPGAPSPQASPASAPATGAPTAPVAPAAAPTAAPAALGGAPAAPGPVRFERVNGKIQKIGG